VRSVELADFLAVHQGIICAELTAVRGSSPREAGTFMLVSGDGLIGTIGGGALEHLVIDRARKVLRDGLPPGILDVPLGPEIGQCCGGRVEVALTIVDKRLAERLQARIAVEEAAASHVYIFGAGHVGHALAAALAPLPLHVTVVDTRREALAGLPDTVTATATALPEAVVRSAPSGSVYCILTHDHALDFLIAGEALKRRDAPYVGMVGSKTKRARFATWFKAEGGEQADLDRLVLPIGAAGLGDKRPAVIAALAAAEIMVHIGRHTGRQAQPAATAKSGAAVGK